MLMRPTCWELLHGFRWWSSVETKGFNKVFCNIQTMAYYPLNSHFLKHFLAMLEGDYKRFASASWGPFSPQLFLVQH